MRRAEIECLESRQFLSVSAAVLAGPLKPGHSLTYLATSAGTSHSYKLTVIGPAKILGKAATEIDQTQTFKTSTTTVKHYYALNSTGLIGYEDFTDLSFGGTDETTTSTFSPPMHIYPASMSAGKSYTFSWTQNSISTPGNLHTTTHTKITVKLVSDKLQSVTTPAGKFSAYLIDQTSGINTTASASGTTEQIWIAPNIGVVKTVVKTGKFSTTIILTARK